MPNAPATTPQAGTPSSSPLTLEKIGSAYKAKYNNPTLNKISDWMMGAKVVADTQKSNPQAPGLTMLGQDQLKRIPSNLDDHLKMLSQAFNDQANPPKQQPLDTPMQSVVKTAEQFPANAASSAVNFAKGLGTMVMHPIQTVKNLANVGAGAVESPLEIFGLKTGQTDAFNQAVQKMIVDRYGSIDKAAQTIYKDPVGFLADLSTVAGGVGAAADAADAGKVADVANAAEGADAASTAGKVAQTANKISDLTNPIDMAAKGISKVGGGVAKGAAWLGKQAIGKLAGVGIDNVNDFSRIMRSGSTEERTAAVDMMRNNDAFRQTYDSIVSAAKQLKANRGDNYKASLATLDHGTSYDVSPITNKMKSLVEDYTKKPLAGDGSVDFSVSGIKQADRADIQQAVSAVQNRLKMQGGRTLDSLDSLKQDLHNLSQGLSPKAKSFITQLEKETKGVLTSNVKGYAAMEADYAQKSNMLDELVNEFSPSSMKNALGMGGRGAFSTGVKKIISLAKTDDSFKRDILEQLQSQDGVDKNLIAQLSGASFSPYLSEGGIGKMAEGFGLVTAFFNPAEMLHLGALFTVTSPRVMGELLNGLGYSGKAIDAFRQFMTSPAGKNLQNFIVRGGVAAQRTNQSQQQQ